MNIHIHTKIEDIALSERVSEIDKLKPSLVPYRYIESSFCCCISISN